MGAYTEHIAGHLCNGVQTCTRCGRVLCDFRGVTAPHPNGAPEEFQPGARVYVNGPVHTRIAPRNVTINECRRMNTTGGIH